MEITKAVTPFQPQQPPAAAPPAPPTQHPSSPAGKKRRVSAVAKGGATTLAALCCLLLFTGPSLPGLRPVGLPSGAGPAGGGSSALQLAGEQRPLAARGRVLQAVPGFNGSLAHGAAESEAGGAANQMAAAEMLLLPLDTETEQRSLQHLRELAPSALLASRQQQRGAGGSLQPAGFAALADSVFLPQGLSSADTCQRVFSFEAAAAAERALASRGGGRKAFGRALPLPPAGGSLPALERAARAEADGGSSSCSDEDYIISVMLPTKEAPAGADGDSYGGGSYQSLDKLFVVVLNPEKQLTTYSCPLRRTILA